VWLRGGAGETGGWAAVEAGPAAAEAGAAAVERGRSRQLAVDEVGDPLVEVAQDLLLLRLRQAAGRHGAIELPLPVVLERGDQAVDGLVLVLCNLGQRLAAVEAALELGLGQAEVARGRA